MKKAFPGGRIMELIIPLLVFVVFFVLQIWVLPRLGFKT
jgi:hypothetical protein